MSKEIINDQKDKYQKNFLKHGDTPQGVFLNNKITQFLRFERLLKNFDLSSKLSIHDIGCGTAALHEYLIEKKIDHEYYGSEIIPDMVETVKKKYPEVTIKEQDILTAVNIKKCDICIVSGTFNLGGHEDTEKWKQYTLKMLKKVFELCDNGMAINFLTTHKTFTDSSLYYFDPAEILNFCLNNLSRYVIIDHGYPLYEFTVTVYKNSYMKEKYTNEDFSKYFKNDK